MRRVALVLALTAPLAAGAQQQLAGTPDVATRRARLQQQLDGATYAAVMRTIDGAAQRQLPVEPLYNRAAEGLLQGAQGPRIRAAVEAAAKRLAEARTALEPYTVAADVEAGAMALANKVPASALRALRALRPGGSISAELGVLTSLVASRVPVEHAVQRIAELMRADTRPLQIVAMGDSVRKDVASGRKPVESFDARARGILAAGSADGTFAADGRNVESTMMPNAPATGVNVPRNAPQPTRAPRKP